MSCGLNAYPSLHGKACVLYLVSFFSHGVAVTEGFCTCAKPSMENEDTHSILLCSTQKGNEERRHVTCTAP